MVMLKTEPIGSSEIRLKHLKKPSCFKKTNISHKKAMITALLLLAGQRKEKKSEKKKRECA